MVAFPSGLRLSWRALAWHAGGMFNGPSLSPERRLELWRGWEAALEAGLGEQALPGNEPAGAALAGPAGRAEDLGGELFFELCRAGEALRRQAHSPYSRLSLGALLLGADGRLYPGVNVENASFGLTNCAERSAVFTAVTAGQRRFLMCFLQGQEPEPIPPCGACRQVLHEFSPRQWVVSRGSSGRLLVMRLDRLLPGAMGAVDLPAS
jgi:cytidine deaminase